MLPPFRWLDPSRRNEGRTVVGCRHHSGWVKGSHDEKVATDAELT
jgi:hypothetical protein